MQVISSSYIPKHNNFTNFFVFSPVTFLLWLWQVLLFVNMSINEYVYVLLYTLTCTLFMAKCVSMSLYILVVVYHKTFIMTMSFYHWRFFVFFFGSQSFVGFIYFCSPLPPLCMYISVCVYAFVIIVYVWSIFRAKACDKSG